MTRKNPYIEFVADFYRSLNKIPLETAILRKIVHVIESPRLNKFKTKSLYKLFLPKGNYSTIKLPHNLRVYVNHPATLITGLGGIFISNEYFLNPSYMPNKNEIIFDIGSYVGLYSLVSSRLMNGKGKIFAIEPNPNSHYWLKNNIKLNDVKNVSTMQLALGKNKGHVRFYTFAGNPGVSTIKSAHLKGRGKNRIGTTFKVPTTTFDELVDELKLKRVNLVKIDVEGAELDVLEGAARSLKAGIVDKLVIEVHETVNNVETVTSYIRKFGYTIDNIFRFHMKSLVYARR